MSRSCSVVHLTSGRKVSASLQWPSVRAQCGSPATSKMANNGASRQHLKAARADRCEASKRWIITDNLKGEGSAQPALSHENWLRSTWPSSLWRATPCAWLKKHREILGSFKKSINPPNPDENWQRLHGIQRTNRARLFAEGSTEKKKWKKQQQHAWSIAPKCFAKKRFLGRNRMRVIKQNSLPAGKFDGIRLSPPRFPGEWTRSGALRTSRGIVRSPAKRNINTITRSRTDDVCEREFRSCQRMRLFSSSGRLNLHSAAVGPGAPIALSTPSGFARLAWERRSGGGSARQYWTRPSGVPIFHQIMSKSQT